MKILCIGAGKESLVGSRVVEILKNNHKMIVPSLEDLNILNTDSIEKYFSQNQFDTLINFAAATNVNKCEEEEVYRSINYIGVENITEALTGQQFIQISTDYVFNGENGPYREYDIPSPVNQYGLSKLKGEEIALGYGNSKIVRIAFPYKESGEKSDTVRWIVSSLLERNTISLFSNLMADFTFIDDIANSLDEILSIDKKIFHVTGEERMSVYRAGEIIIEKLKEKGEKDFDQYITSGTVDNTNSKVKRPLNGGLVTQWKDLYKNFHRTPFNEGVQRVINSLLT